MACPAIAGAVHGTISTGGGPRNKEYIYGIPGLGEADTHRVSFGDRTMLFTCSIIRVCRALKIPCCPENPSSSYAWSAPPLNKLAQQGHQAVSDFCQYGKPWRKRTRVAAWNVEPSLMPCKKCTGRGTCSRTAKPHIILTGTHPTFHIAMTKYAEPYPISWVHKWWNCLDNASFASSCVQSHARWLG